MRLPTLFTSTSTAKDSATSFPHEAGEMEKGLEDKPPASDWL